MLLATFTVTNNFDSGRGSLRQAILNANTTLGTDTINFNIKVGAISEVAIPTPNSVPLGITAGPDGNLWFTEAEWRPDRPDHPRRHHHRIPAPHAQQRARRDHGRARRQPLVHRAQWRPDRPDHPRRHRHRIHRRSRPTAAPRDHGRARRQPLVHRVQSATGSAGSPPAAPSPNSAIRHHAQQRTRRDHGRARRQPLVHRAHGDRIGRITPGGTVTEFAPHHAQQRARGITAGPDGNLWFTESRATRSAGSRPAAPSPNSRRHHAQQRTRGITAGPDGNLWFTEPVGDRIGRITPGGTVTEFSAGITPNSAPVGITAGPDGNLWFTETRWQPDRSADPHQLGADDQPNLGPTGDHRPGQPGWDHRTHFSRLTCRGSSDRPDSTVSGSRRRRPGPGVQAGTARWAEPARPAARL